MLTVKARYLGGGKAARDGGTEQGPVSVGAGEAFGGFGGTGAIEPPYDPERMCTRFEQSAALRPNIDAYAVNIDGFGHRLEPAIDFNAEDADQAVADAIFAERVAAAGAPDARVATAPDGEVAARRAEIETLARVERARLDAFFEFCCYDHSFVELRRRTRQDKEATGNAYWEVVRNNRGDVARFVHVPAHTMRLLPLDKEPVDTWEYARVSAVSFERVPVRRRLRRFVQVVNGETTYFKSFRDPRPMSRLTGRVYGDVAQIRADRADDGPATEIVHFAIHSPSSPYGVPRWAGSLLAVIGARAAEEVNYLYFDNKSVPPLALIVEGGRLSEGSIPRIENFIEQHLKGKTNFHKILILEADAGDEPNADPSKVRIRLQPLTEAQQQDALFLNYDERNTDKIGGAFRLPRLLRGDTRDFNRATAEAALRFAEDQVFAPEREEFDFWMNRVLLPELGVRFWRFRSLTPITRDPERLSAIIERMMRANVLVPAEARDLAVDVFNRTLRPIHDDWTKRPITLTLAGIQTGVGDLRGAGRDGADGGAGLLEDAQRLMALRDELEGEEARLAARRLELARKYEAESADVLRVPRAEFEAWIAGKTAGGEGDVSGM